MNNERENYSWGIIQDMIEKEISAAFKLREPPIIPTKKAIINTIKQTVKQHRNEMDVHHYNGGNIKS